MGPEMRRPAFGSVLFVCLLGPVGLSACSGCRAPSQANDAPPAGPPTVRLYVTSTMAGALEPCGCTKDQLGGIDHLAAWMRAQARAAPASLFVGAGPMLYLEPKLRSGDASQDTWKAEAIANAMKALGMAAWAPGSNDWAGGDDTLSRCRELSGAELLAGNVPGLRATLVREVGGVKVGVVGVADPWDRVGGYPKGIKPTAALDAMKAGLDAVKREGAQIFVGLAALSRGDALRLADNVPELHVLVVGKASEAGEANDAPKPPVLAGSTLVVETANHLQSVGVVDLHVRPGGQGPLVFADAGGVARAGELLVLSSRIHDLESRINSWERDQTVKSADLVARKADLDRLRAQRVKMEQNQPAPKGSFFRFATVEVRAEMGVDEAVRGAMAGYYKRVNEHNKVAYAERLPPPPAAGQSSYTGVDACTECHEEARAVWDKTPHAKAYATLVKDFKEFNFDCTSCHVTGYDKPGGSTITHVEKLQNVQCEACHGPGSLHAKDPKNKALIVGNPQPATLCAQCHHPPHVEGFDPLMKLNLILGPGHGQPKVDGGAPAPRDAGK
jgi:hypothetical protein